MSTAVNPPHSLDAAYAQCEDILRHEDPDRWLAALFLPADKRRHVHALIAFSLEIARVQQLVSEPRLGEIRFQWWREAILGERKSEALANPVAAALIDTLARFDLPRDLLYSLIDARLFDLWGEPMPSLATLEAYAKATAANLFHLAGLIVAPAAGEALAAAAKPAGIAYAMTGLLRALPWHGAAGQVYMPAELLAAQGLAAADVAAGRTSPQLLAALAELRGVVRHQLRLFEERARSVPGAGAAVFLPVQLCEAYLRQMERADYDPFHSRIELPQWRRQWILWRAARRIR